jgi:hypothetical protein
MGVGQPHCNRRLRGSWRTQRLLIIAFRALKVPPGTPRNEPGTAARRGVGGLRDRTTRRLGEIMEAQGARAGLMNGADRKAAKSELRAALRAKARGLPLSPPAEAVMLCIAWLKQAEGDQAAVGTSLTVIAWHERIGERTIQNRIDQSLDAMRREFSGHNGLRLPRI